MSCRPILDDCELEFLTVVNLVQEGTITCLMHVVCLACSGGWQSFCWLCLCCQLYRAAAVIRIQAMIRVVTLIARFGGYI